MNYLGLDYHKKYSFATIITEQGEIKEKEKLFNRKESFKEYLRGYEGVVAVVEAVKPAISSNGELRSYYERIRYKKGPKAAKLATARRLLAIVYRVLKEKDPFKLYEIDLTKKAESPSSATSAAYCWHS